MREEKEINVKIGEQVRIARKRIKLTQEQLAERIEVSTQYVSDLERGVVGISVPTLKRICLALGVSSDQLLFAAQSEDEYAAIIERCKCLSHKQFVLLSQIIECYIKAIKEEE